MNVGAIERLGSLASESENAAMRASRPKITCQVQRFIRQQAHRTVRMPCMGAVHSGLRPHVHHDVLVALALLRAKRRSRRVDSG